MASISANLTIAAQVRRINKQLNSVADRCSGPVGDTLLTQASLIASEQRGLAPIDPSSPTPGALKESVRVEQGHATEGKAIVVKIKAGGRTTQKQGSSRTYDYAMAVEFGTKDMVAEPFFYPVARARKKEARAAVRKAIKNAVKDTFK